MPRRPEVTVTPQTVDSMEHAFVEVTCDAVGIPQPEIVWQRLDGGFLPAEATSDYGILRFTSLRKSDEGQYRCIARNSVGTADGILNVYVRQSSPPTSAPPTAPTVLIQPNYYTGQPGDEVKLTCTSNEQGQIAWKK